MILQFLWKRKFILHRTYLWKTLRVFIYIFKWLYFTSDFTSNFKWLHCLTSFNPFFPNAPFLYLPENIRNLTVFWCFQERKSGFGTNGLTHRLREANHHRINHRRLLLCAQCLILFDVICANFSQSSSLLMHLSLESNVHHND